MKKRLLKVISLPIAVFFLMIPMLIIQSILWIIFGKKTPLDRVEEYFNWLKNE